MIDVARAITQNRRYSVLLGWEPSDIVPAPTTGPHVIDDRFVASVESLQARLKVSVDGVVGPGTYGAVLIDQIAAISAGGGYPGDRLLRAGMIAMRELKACWLKNIPDAPAGFPVIESMICTTRGINWTWEKPYKGHFQWCGAAAAYAWRNSIALDWRRDFFSSNYRLDRWASYRDHEQYKNPRPSQGPYRCIVELHERSKLSDVSTFGGTGPRAGDILLVGDGIPSYGDHVTIVEYFDPVTSTFHTLEGNGRGESPTGATFEGVVRAMRTLGLPPGAPSGRYIARRLIRPAPGDIL